MLLAALNLMLITVLIFIAGMIKPRWVLFFLDKPSRTQILSITLVLVMISFTMYGQAISDKKKEEAAAALPIPTSAVPVPVPAPAPAPGVATPSSSPQAPSVPTAPH
ncbi:hypothetical protein [Methylocucumis oryzae]|uniref:Uncharacterized protein n=1 Tax=Methylocucumis oryzae TaxID=1632867 RepID=A0A0F3III6_9GAMM|nr:hypothetical protein [Methylocucumis oryzae]KJV06487.1 hypothetical protein VZ94_10890 [Methylocucumis oryzae]